MITKAPFVGSFLGEILFVANQEPSFGKISSFDDKVPDSKYFRPTFSTFQEMLYWVYL